VGQGGGKKSGAGSTKGGKEGVQEKVKKRPQTPLKKGYDGKKPRGKLVPGLFSKKGREVSTLPAGLRQNTKNEQNAWP